MPAPRSLIRTQLLHISVPEPDLARLQLHLYSPLEQRVPKGAYQSWLVQRIREFFGWKALDLAPWADSPPGAFVLHGEPAAIEALRKTLTELSLDTTQ